MYVFVMQTVVVGKVYQYRTLREVKDKKTMWNNLNTCTCSGNHLDDKTNYHVSPY